MPAADQAFRSLAHLLRAPVEAEVVPVPEPVAPVPEAAELSELAREVRLLRARLTDAETVLAELHERFA